jgi:hypothetical protein
MHVFESIYKKIYSNKGKNQAFSKNGEKSLIAPGLIAQGDKELIQSQT